MAASLQTAPDDHLLSGTFGLSLLPTSARFLSSFPPSFLGGSNRRVHSMSLESAGRWPCPGADGDTSKNQPLTLGQGGSRSVQRPSQRIRPPWASCALSPWLCAAFTPLASCVCSPPGPEAMKATCASSSGVQGSICHSPSCTPRFPFLEASGGGIHGFCLPSDHPRPFWCRSPFPGRGSGEGGAMVGGH